MQTFTVKSVAKKYQIIQLHPIHKGMQLAICKNRSIKLKSCNTASECQGEILQVKNILSSKFSISKNLMFQRYSICLSIFLPVFINMHLCNTPHTERDHWTFLLVRWGVLFHEFGQVLIKLLLHLHLFLPVPLLHSSNALFMGLAELLLFFDKALHFFVLEFDKFKVSLHPTSKEIKFIVSR